MRCREVAERRKPPGAARRNRAACAVPLIVCLTLAAASADGADDLAQTYATLARPKMLSDVAERVRGGDMPPEDAPQPSQAEREQLLGGITAALDAEAAARAGEAVKWPVKWLRRASACRHPRSSKCDFPDRC